MPSLLQLIWAGPLWAEQWLLVNYSAWCRNKLAKLSGTSCFTHMEKARKGGLRKFLFPLSNCKATCNLEQFKSVDKSSGKNNEIFDFEQWKTPRAISSLSANFISSFRLGEITLWHIAIKEVIVSRQTIFERNAQKRQGEMTNFVDRISQKTNKIHFDFKLMSLFVQIPLTFWVDRKKIMRRCNDEEEVKLPAIFNSPDSWN